MNDTSPPSSDASGKPRVSVVIVSWNAVGYLRRCLASLRETRVSDGEDCVAEIIVVDNQSSDGSPDMVKREFPEVTLVHAGSNLGFGRANNVGFARVGSPFVALVNSDALVHAGCLQSLRDYLVAQPRAGLVGPLVFGGDGRQQATCRRLPTLWNLLCRALALDRLFPDVAALSGFEIPRHLLRNDQVSDAEVVSGCFCVARAEAIEQVGGFDEQFFFYGEDIDWCRRFAAAGWKVQFVPHASATHFGGGSTANAPLRYSIEILSATLKYWRKHHSLPSQWACHGLLLLHHGMRLAARGVVRFARAAVGLRNSSRSHWKFQEDRVCVQWLLTPKSTGTASRNATAGVRDEAV
ncbi:MAG: hypothetical protein JWP52_1679 [Rhizobacter sp.]|nr:hypothetical protein [Rhizobacter sp.]